MFLILKDGKMWGIIWIRGIGFVSGKVRSFNGVGVWFLFCFVFGGEGGCDFVLDIFLGD